MKKRVKKERLHFFRVSYEVECESAQRLYKLLKEGKTTLEIYGFDALIEKLKAI